MGLKMQTATPITAPLWAVKLKKTGREVAEPVPDHSASTKQEDVKCEDVLETGQAIPVAEPVKVAAVVPVEAVTTSDPLSVKSEPDEAGQTSSEEIADNQAAVPTTTPLWAVKLKKTGREVAEPVPDQSARKVVAKVVSKTTESSTQSFESIVEDVPSAEPKSPTRTPVDPPAHRQKRATVKVITTISIKKKPAAPTTIDSSDSKMLEDPNTTWKTTSASIPTEKSKESPLSQTNTSAGPAVWSLGKLKKTGLTAAAPTALPVNPPPVTSDEKSTETTATEDSKEALTAESAADTPTGELSAALLNIETKAKPAPSSGAAPAWAVKLKKTGVDVVEKESDTIGRKVVAPSPKKNSAATATLWSMSKLKKTGLNVETEK
jgi:uncharacterized membrane protein